MKKQLTDNAKKFLSKNPTRIGIVMGFTFYECPVYGEDVPLKVITPDGKYKSTDFYELPESDDYPFI